MFSLRVGDAHSLADAFLGFSRTVVDYDRILVLDAGVVIEYDAPDVLLAREDGVFRGMWEEQTQSTPSSGLTSR